MAAPASTAKALALAISGAAVLASFPVAAQQMAANRTAPPDFSRCVAMSETNPKGAIVCQVEVLQAHTRQMQQNTRQLQQETARARQETVAAEAGVQSEAQLSICISFLTAKKASGVTFDRPITRDNACAVARQLGMTNG